MGVAAGVCLAVAVGWFPLWWVLRLRASGWLQWQRSKSDRPDWADDRPMERIERVSDRLARLWQVPVALGVAAVALIVIAVVMN